MYSYLLVGIGGFLGAVARFGVSKTIKAYFNHPFPAATLFVNFAGCFVAGFIMESLRGHRVFPHVISFLIVGFLGSFTTFSAFGFETVELVRSNQMRIAFANVLANVLLCIAAVVSGGVVGSYTK